MISYKTCQVGSWIPVLNIIKVSMLLGVVCGSNQTPFTHARVSKHLGIFPTTGKDISSPIM